MLPIPKNSDVRSLVIKDEETKTTWEGKSNCAIEHLFYGIKGIDDYFNKVQAKGMGFDLKFASNKEDFAKVLRGFTRAVTCR
jgi:hypothetical protein